ncbi:MAG: class I adenylate-forming enzyme family protein [Candidatus Binatia bacterium]|nr:class I adenylate-forming enzyme family protein [Candidatus Binatia bacterium]
MAEALYRHFEDRRRESPAAEAVLDVDAGRRFTRDGLAALVDQVAGSVRAAASEAGVVAVQSENAPELIAAVLAAWRENLVPLPIDRERDVAEIETLARSLGIGMLLRGRGLERHAIPGVRAEIALPTEAAVLKLTSGTTGEPRAVAVAGPALELGVSQICSTMGIRAGDRNLVTVPLAHSYAFDNVLGTLVMQGTPAVLVSDLVPRRLFSVVRETGVTVWPSVPLLLDVLSRSPAGGEAPLGSLRLVISAGAPLPATTRENFAKRFHLRPRTFYGATECGGIAFDREADREVPDGCVGRPLDGVSIDLLDGEDGVGRISVRSGSVALGTLPTASPEISAGRLLASDLGRLDEEGRLHLIGRVGQFVKIHGHKVYPIEVERVLRGLPGVLDAAVVPYARSDVSEGLRAIVAAGDGIDRATIARGCERVLPSYKVPRSIEIRDEVPRNERGKLDRRRL